MTSWMVGIDTGGTFTDLIAFDVASGERRVAKVPSVPADPSAAVMNALGELFEAGVAPGDISFLVHGTTVATNGILEGKGARTGLLITRGFSAVYEGRGWSQPAADDLLDPYYTKPPLLAPQSLTEEVTERLNYLGEVETALDEDDVRRAVQALKSRDVEAVAICYLFSFRNSDHEERTAAIIAEEAPHWRVSVSSRILPTIREYPRLSTTVIDAFVGKSMETYLLRLEDQLQKTGVKTSQIFLMQSNGGLMRINVGARYPNQTLLSGPAAGVVSGIELAKLIDRQNVVTFDMGGTSTDISVIQDGRSEETTAGRIAGQDLATPMLAVSTLGAGGGTIAWIGKDGLMKVGPQSSGADPGPACYGKGGKLPTVTDANLILGALGSGNALGGRLTLDKEAAEAAVKTHLAEPLGLNLIDAASGILRIVNANMAVDLRLAFQYRGVDPRDFALVAFGGAGPLHASILANELKIPAVLVPPNPGLNSAMGLLQTNVKHVYLRSDLGLLSGYEPGRMNDHFAALRERAVQDVEEENFELSEVRFRHQVDMRYLHQGYELAIDCPETGVTDADKASLKTRFDTRHKAVYGMSAEDEDAEIVTFRLLAEITVPSLTVPKLDMGDGDIERAKTETRPLYDLGSGGFNEAAIYDRAKLLAGDHIDGPAVIEQFDSTTVITATQTAMVDPYGNIIIEKRA
jgi:N-methylhydantoinase A